MRAVPAGFSLDNFVGLNCLLHYSLLVLPLFGLTRVYSFRHNCGLTLKPSSSYAR